LLVGWALSGLKADLTRKASLFVDNQEGYVGSPASRFFTSYFVKYSLPRAASRHVNLLSQFRVKNGSTLASSLRQSRDNSALPVQIRDSAGHAPPNFASHYSPWDGLGETKPIM
jgi:hypothetical protein